MLTQPFHGTFGHIMQICRHMHLQCLHANQSVPLQRNHYWAKLLPELKSFCVGAQSASNPWSVFSSSRTVEEPEAHAPCARSPGTCCSAAAVFCVARTPGLESEDASLLSFHLYGRKRRAAHPPRYNQPITKPDENTKTKSGDHKSLCVSSQSA